LILEAKTPKALGYILRGHGATPTTLKVMYGNINLLELVVTTGLRVCHVDLQFADEALETGMFSYEAWYHVKSETCRDAYVVSKLTEGFSGILIITWHSWIGSKKSPFENRNASTCCLILFTFKTRKSNIHFPPRAWKFGIRWLMA
jgi:hypothetical protein